MRWASALSTQADTAAALGEVTGLAGARSRGRARRSAVRLRLARITRPAIESVLSALREAAPGARVAGCSAAGLDRRRPRGRRPVPAPSLTGGLAARACNFRWRRAMTRSTSARCRRAALRRPRRSLHLRLRRAWSARSTSAFPDSSKVGGLASGGRFAGENALLCDHRIYRGGAVVVALGGDLALETIIAQGCRAIGRPMVVTRARTRTSSTSWIDASRATVLQELYDTLGKRDQELFRSSLFVGIEMRSQQIEVRAGEFLVRNMVGMDRRRPARSPSARRWQPWQVVQLLLRDARTAEEDLKRLLDRHRQGNLGRAPRARCSSPASAAARSLFGRPDHDTGLFREYLGPVPLGGFFCSGEIGPVGGTTFLHGYTSAFGLFRPRGQ